MGNMRFFDKNGNPDTSTEEVNSYWSGISIISVQGDLIYSGPYKVTRIAANTTVFAFNGAESDMKGNNDFMVIWCQNWQMVFYPDKNGNIRAGAADWVQGDEYLEWDETPGSPESDIFVPDGAMWTEARIVRELGNLLLEEESPELTEIASKVYEMVLMVRNSDI